MAAKTAPAKVVVQQPNFGKAPHNGEGRPEFQFPDPITGERIGGQVAYIRTAMRFPRFVAAWARRTGKTSTRPHLYYNEQVLTPGIYYAGMLFPDHTTAHKIWDAFRRDMGGLVVDAKGDDKSQDRWIQLLPVRAAKGEAPPAWYTETLVKRWARTQETPNDGAKIYFWSGQHPYYQRIQGFTHPFHRISPDEAQQIHPGWRKILMPMLRDAGGYLDVSGTPDVEGIGNPWFEEFFLNGEDPARPTWACLRFPDGVNPWVTKDARTADEDLGTEEAIRQARYAEFLSDQGAVFRNLSAVFSSPFLKSSTGEPLWPSWLHDLAKQHPIRADAWFSRFEPVEKHIYGITVDWARSLRGDRSVVSVWNFTLHRQEALFSWRGEDFTQQMEWVLAIQKRFGASQCHSDANGMGEAMSDFMRRRHAVGFVGHKFSANNKRDYVRKAQILFQEGHIAMLDCVTQRREFKTFREILPNTDNSETTVRYSHPPGGHDDFVSAFLQIAPTLSIIGRQAVPFELDGPPPIRDGKLSLQYFGNDPLHDLAAT